MIAPTSSGWTVKRLLDLVSIRSGQVDPRRTQYRDMPLIAPDHLESGTGRLLETRSAHEQGAISGKYLVDPGDIIYSKIRPYLMKAHLAEFSALCSADMYPLKPRDGADGRFVLNVLLGRDFTNFAVGESMRSGIPKINREGLAGYELQVPPHEEQRLVGAALKDADDLIDSVERLIAKKRAIKKGMMQELLTGRTRLPGFDGEWRTRAIGSIAQVVMGQSPSGTSYNTTGIGTPLIQGNADIRNRLTFDRVWTTAPAKRVLANDVVLTVRAPVGYAALASKDACLGRGVCGISAGQSTRFLFHSLVYREPRWALLEQGSTFTSVNSDQVRAFEIEWPDAVDERVTIAHVLDDADAEIEALERRLEATRDIKRGMMQELLTGRTRLPVDEEVAV